MESKMFVVTHKKLEKMIDTPNYHYIQVNTCKNGNLGFEYSDDADDNISTKNDSFCELTALYWIWKNDCSNNVGLSHYRRFFYHSFRSIFKPRVYQTKELDKILRKFDLIMVLPSRMTADNAKNVYEQFKQEHNIEDLDITRDIILEMYPDYVKSFDEVMLSSSISLRNMFYAQKEIINEYSKWLFDILFELEKRTNIKSYDSYQSRLYGFISERLFNVYVKKNNFRVKYLPICFTEEMTLKNYIGKNLHLLHYKIFKK